MGNGRTRTHSVLARAAAVLLAFLMGSGIPSASVHADGQEAAKEKEVTSGQQLSGETQDSSPEHHKFIRYNGDDSYTLTLNVKGMYDSEKVTPKLDVLLIVDRSGSMDEKYGSGNSAPTRMEKLQEVVTGTKGLSQAILGNDEIDARMAVVAYSGNKGSKYEKDAAYNDAVSIIPNDWTTDQNVVNVNVNAIEADGGTNCQAGLLTGEEVLEYAREDAQKIVIFLSDGLPTFRYNESGLTVGEGNADSNGENAEAAYQQAAQLSGLSGFYSIGISTDSSSSFLNTLKDKPGAEKKAYYSAANADGLVSAFQSIISDITEYTCRNVTIEDTLSVYVEAEDPFQPVIKVTDKNGSEVTEVEFGGEYISVSDLIHVSYQSETKKVTAVFREGYVLDQDYTYSVSFNVKPTQLAYDTYADMGYNAVGSARSDAPGNDTSSGKDGFYSNAEGENGPTLIYTFGKSDDAAVSCASYVEKPVIQVSALTIPVEKKWENVSEEDVLPQEVTVNLYQDDGTDAYRTVTLTGQEEWKGSFCNVAKGHTYTVKETDVTGFESRVEGDEKNGFIVTNTRLPDLVINKEVTGKMGDKTKAFTMVIQIKDKNGKEVNGTFSYIGGQKTDVKDANTAVQDGLLTFTNGTAAIELKHGQQITLKQLPLGGTFTVEESDEGAAGYSVSYNGDWTEEASGTLDKDALVEVVNQKDAVPVTGIVETQGGSILVSGIAGLAFVEGICALTLRRRRRS